jgi:hypothetical protein
MKANLNYDEFEVTEFPPRPLFNFNAFIPDLLPIRIEEYLPLFDDLKLRLKYNGQPMLMLPIDESEIISDWKY